jgi:hypothetical protein
MIQDFAEVGRVSSLVQYLSRTAGLCAILVWLSGNFLSGFGKIPIFSHPGVICWG